MANLKDYEPIVGRQIIDELKILGDRLGGKVIKNINSTAVGGGVAEILNRMVPLLNEIGVDARWILLKGDEAFFQVTKKFHNALHGRNEKFTHRDYDIFMENTNRNLDQLDLDGDLLFIHDPQPIGLVQKKKHDGRKWLWRCHIDFTNPQKDVWIFLKRYINQYDAAVFSAPSFARPLEIRQFLIAPSIDPLSDKNRELSKKEVNDILQRLGIKRNKPIITQISRFDYLKDPFGVIDAFRLVRKYVDCQLILAGGSATDDPEGEKVLNEVREKIERDRDIHILLLPPASHLEINAIQRASDVVLQKSLKEGFGLTVAEALWKGKPVVASAVGGIPLQITHRYSGLLSHTIEGTAHLIKQLLHSPEYAKKLGKNGKEHIRQNFLLTRHLRDYMLLFLLLIYKKGKFKRDVIHMDMK